MFGEQKGEIGPGNYQPIYSFSESKGRDNKLRFFEECKKYKELEESSAYTMDKKAYQDRYFPKIAKNITNIIGAEDHWKVTEKDVTLIMEMCSAEYNMNNTRDRFCSLFSQEDFESIELYYDIGAYHTMGYGWDLSYQIACPLVSDIIGKMERKINGSDNSKAFLRFAHAETIVPLLARMGLFKDPFQISWNTDSQLLKDRKWKTSHFATFASNVAFALYRCPTDYKVEVSINEGQIAFEKCNNEIFCSFSQFRNMFDFIHKCDFDNICDIHNSCAIPQETIVNNTSYILILIIAACVITIIVGLTVYYQCRSSYERIESDKDVWVKSL